MGRSSTEATKRDPSYVSPPDVGMGASPDNARGAQSAREQSREIHQLIAASSGQSTDGPAPGTQVQLSPSGADATAESDLHMGSFYLEESERRLDDCRELLEQNRGLRAELDATPHEDGAARESLIGQLSEGRFALLDAIRETLSYMDESNLTEELTDQQLSELEEMRSELEDRLESLIRWQLHEEIEYINDELGVIEGELADPALDEDVAMLLELRQEHLLERRAEVTAQLTADVLEYEQWDERWDDRPYGEGEGCDPMQGGGCGPTSLAIILNYLAQADPEAERDENGEIILPPEVADMALAEGARTCGSGTNSERMIRGLPENFPGRVGREIDGMDDLDETLRSGQIVLGSLGSGVVGETSHGTDSRTYDGHVIVLRSVSADGQRYRVLDCGANEATDIEWLTRDQIDDHFRRIWTVTMEY